ncbi:MAG: PepSY domain-containing protein, partial [Pseudomonadota bacterium]
RRKNMPLKQHSRGYRFVEAMNIGTIMGLMIGVAAFFLANRLLPLGMEHRADWEANCLFITWAACLAYPLFRTYAEAWREQAWLAAIAYAAIPVVNALTTDAHLGNTIPAGDWALAGFDLTAIATAIFFATAAVLIGRHKVPREADEQQAIKSATTIDTPPAGVEPESA